MHGRVGLLALLVVALTPTGALSDPIKDCFDLLTTVEQRECAEQLYRSASSKLTEEFTQAVARAAKADRRETGDPEGWAAAMRASQERWEAYRDAECVRVVGYGRGSATRAMVNGCLAEKTLQRIRELQVPFYQR